MVIWLHGYMVICLNDYMVIWLYGYIVIWLYGYMVIFIKGSDKILEFRPVTRMAIKLNLSTFL